MRQIFAYRLLNENSIDVGPERNGGAIVDGRMLHFRQRYLGGPNGVARRHQGRSR